MNWKVIVLGGLAYFITSFIIGMATGPLIHQGVLTEVYTATAVFWRPELNEVPPDMAALMPQWLTVGFITSLILAGIYDHVRSAFSGSAVIKGMKFGFVVFLLNSSFMVSMSGVFNLPNEIWGWWIAEGLVYLLIGGAALGWTCQKFSPE
jgi:hypothetical protein